MATVPGSIRHFIVINNNVYAYPIGNDMDMTYYGQLLVHYSPDNGPTAQLIISGQTAETYSLLNVNWLEIAFQRVAVTFNLQTECVTQRLVDTNNPYIFEDAMTKFYFFEAHGQDRIYYGPYETSIKASIARTHLMYPKTDPYDYHRN